VELKLLQVKSWVRSKPSDVLRETENFGGKAGKSALVSWNGCAGVKVAVPKSHPTSTWFNPWKIHDSMALFHGKLKTSVMRGRGIGRWYCLVGGDRSQGDNAMQGSWEEQCWVRASAGACLGLVSPAFLSRQWECWLLKIPARSRQRISFEKRGFRKGGRCGDKSFGWQGVILWQLIQSEILKNKLQWNSSSFCC